MTQVALSQGDYRKENVASALRLINGDVAQKLKTAPSIIVKPNLVHHKKELASSHVDAVRAVLDFVREHSRVPVVIGDASYHGTKAAFRNFGYENLPNEYDAVRLMDLNDDDVVPATRIDSRGNAVQINKGLSKIAVESGFKISVTNMKTHRDVGVTLGVKNWAVGTWVAPSKIGPTGKYWPRSSQLHDEGLSAHMKSIAHLYGQNKPDLSIIDGFMAMEGDGPTRGEAVPLHVALAGRDALAVDAVACQLMGVRAEEIAYLRLASEADYGIINLSEIEMVGENPSEFKRDFAKPLHWEEILNC